MRKLAGPLAGDHHHYHARPGSLFGPPLQPIKSRQSSGSRRAELVDVFIFVVFAVVIAGFSDDEDERIFTTQLMA